MKKDFHQMIETGRVLKIENGHATVKLSALNCFGCMNAECRKKEGVLDARILSGLQLHEGAFVTVEINKPGLASEALRTALPPIVGFAFAFTITRFLPEWSDALRITFALGVMGLAGACVYLICKKIPAKSIAAITGIAVENET